MLKITTNLESFLLNKGFTLLHSTDYQQWRKAFDLNVMEIFLTSLSDTGEEYGVLVKIMEGGQMKLESTFNLKTPLDILHLESFINMNLPANYPFPKD